MFDKLEDLLHHYEELMNTLSEPDVANDPNRFRKLMKEQSDLQPIVDAYKEYKACKQTIEDSLAILDEESDEEMRELAKEELNEAKSRLGAGTEIKDSASAKRPERRQERYCGDPCRCRWRGSCAFCG